jgi:beta-galactosidase
VTGAYIAFFDSNIQADYVHIDNIAEYPVVYLPYPVALSEATVAKLRSYVEQGGYLISEGMPGYFDEHGHAGEKQPNRKLDQMFGARESDVEFAPDLFTNLTFRVGDREARGALFRQVYEPAGGKAAGWYGDKTVAVVENSFGKGHTWLMGTFPGAAYFRKHDTATRDLFRWFLTWANRKPQLVVSDNTVKARLHAGAGGSNLWIVNPTRVNKDIVVTLANGSLKNVRRVWGAGPATANGSAVAVHLDERDAAVLHLE